MKGSLYPFLESSWFIKVKKSSYCSNSANAVFQSKIFAMWKQAQQILKQDTLIQLPKSLYRIHGTDAVKFLQGLVTNQMTKIEKGGEAMLAAFLNPQVLLFNLG